MKLVTGKRIGEIFVCTLFCRGQSQFCRVTLALLTSFIDRLSFQLRSPVTVKLIFFGRGRCVPRWSSVHSCFSSMCLARNVFFLQIVLNLKIYFLIVADATKPQVRRCCPRSTHPTAWLCTSKTSTYRTQL